MPVRNYSSTSQIVTLAAPASAGDTTITISAAAATLPATPFTMLLAPDTVNEEVVDVTAVAGSALTVTRGVDGTTAKSHAAGTTAIHGVSARDFAEANSHINSTTSVHGIADTSSLETVTGSQAKADAALASASSALATHESDTTSVHGIPDTSQLVLTSDSRLSDARTPTAHKSTHATGGSDPLSPADIGAATSGHNHDAAYALPSQTGNANRLLATNGTSTSWTNSIADSILISPEERCTIFTSAATGTIPIDVMNASVVFNTVAAIANVTINVRGNFFNTFNSRLEVGDSITVVWLNTTGATAYYPTAFQIDGVAQTVKWQGGTAPTSGNASSIDAYTYTIIKTAANPTYTVLGSQTKFA